MVANFSLTGFNGFIGELRVLISTARHNKDHAAKYSEEAVAETEKGQRAMDECVAEIDNFILKQTDALMALVPCAHIAAAADRLRFFVSSNNKTWDRLFTDLCGLRDAVQTELKSYSFYAYPKEKGALYQQWKVDWARVIAAFPDTALDAFSATDCYALGHPTASVFHSMRVAEHGLRALAKERRLKLPKGKAIEWANWQEVIRELDNEIKRIGTAKAGKAKDASLEFYSGARADLNGFKDEYRNLVMHVRQDYDEFQALRALTQVRHFMERVSNRLDHTHRRINWGRS